MTLSNICSLLFIIVFFSVLFYASGKASAKLHGTSVKKEIASDISQSITLLTLFPVWLGIFFLPINIIENLRFEACAIGYNKIPDISIKFPLHINLLTIFVGLAIGWFSARWSNNMSMLNGAVGTKLIGNEKTTNCYISTKWLVYFVPVLPVKSYEVFGVQEGAQSLPLQERVYYSMQPLPKLAKEQIIKTYKDAFLGYFIATVIVIGFALLGTWKCF
jgi:hypothetical protein